MYKKLVLTTHKKSVVLVKYYLKLLLCKMLDILIFALLPKKIVLTFHL